MTCRSPRKEDSAFLSATAVVSVLRKLGNTKIFAAVVLAAVAIAITITASGLWDDSTLAAISDNPAAPATVIPNVSDAWSITLDAVDSIMSSEWLIPPAFAETTAIFPADRTVRGGDIVTISYIVTSNTTEDIAYLWIQNPLTPDLNMLSTTLAPTVTFTAPTVTQPTSIEIEMLVYHESARGQVLLKGYMTLTIIAGNIPIVNAGPDIDVAKGQSYNLTGATATDTEDDNDTLTIAWTAVPSSAVIITNATTLAPTITVPSTTSVTSVILTMSATDSNGNTGDDTRELTIQDIAVVDNPPVANAGPDIDVIKGQSYDLAGTAATDDEDDDATLTIAWTAVPASAVTITDGHTRTPTIAVSSSTTAPSVTLTMSVTDSNGSIGTDTRVLTIQDIAVVDNPPVANAGPDIDVIKGQSYDLAGTAATDDEDDDATLTIAWTAVPASAVTITDGHTRTPTIAVSSSTTAPSVTLTMSVTDSNGSIGTDTRVLTIQDIAVVDNPPVANAGPDIDVIKGQSYDLAGTAATDDEDDDATLTIAWTAVPASAVTITDGHTRTPTIAVSSSTTAPSVTLTMSVTDSNGSIGTDTRVLTIQDVNTAPTVDAGGPLSVALGSSVTPNPTITDPDGYSNHQYTWTQDPADTVTFSDINSLRPTISVATNATLTTVTLTLTVDDNNGEHTVDDTTTLTILDPNINAAPTVDAGGPLSVALGSSVTPNPTITDPDGYSNHQYTWTQDPADTVTFSDINSLRPTISAATNATLTTVTLTLTVDDNNGEHTVDDTTTLTILDPNINAAPTVDAGGPLSVALGSSVTPNPTITDPDGYSNHQYTWTQDPADTVTFSDINSLRPTISAATNATLTTVTLTLTVDDNNGEHTVDDTTTLTILDPNINAAPTVDAGGPLSVALGSSVTPNPTITDPDGYSNHRYTWTQNPADTVTFSDINSLRPTISAATNATPGPVTLTLTVIDNNGEHTVDDTTTLTIFDPNTNVAPTVDVGDDINATERTSVTLTGIADDPNKGDIPTLTYLWTHNLEPGTVVTGNDTKSLRFTAPGISSPTRSFDFTLTVTDGGGETAIDDVTVTVHDVPLEVSYATYNPGNGQLKIIFNQNIESDPSYGSIHVRSADSDSGGITLSNATETSSPYPGRTITAILSTEQQETYGKLQNPQIDIDRGAVTDNDGVSIEETLDIAIITASNKKSSSSTAPIVDLRTLGQARIVDIPQSILEQVSSHDDSDPLKPIPHNDMFDLPLAINGYYYLLDDTTNTLIPQTVTAGQSTEIVFTVYTKTDLAHFTLYLNMQGNDVNYAGSDTYITYKNDGTVSVTDPHGYIADATITVTQEDDSMPEKKTVSITIHFDEPMGSTNVVAYMWNTDRKAAFVNLIDALEVAAAAEISENDDQDSTSTPSIIKSGIVIVGDDDDAQTLSLVRMWSGFESESLTDAELLRSLNFDYPGVDIPNWMMTELGALVSNGDVTVKEFRTALVYMLEMLTA